MLILNTRGYKRPIIPRSTTFFLEQSTPRHKEPCFIHTEQTRRAENCRSAFIPSHPQLSAPMGGTWRTSPGVPASALSTTAGAAPGSPFPNFPWRTKALPPLPRPSSSQSVQTKLPAQSEEAALPPTASAFQRG